MTDFPKSPAVQAMDAAMRNADVNQRENADEAETRMPVKRDALWAVTAVAHPAVADYRGHCEDCMNLTNEAIDIARATGSRGATAENRTPGGETHSATVARVIRTVTR